MTTSQSSSKSNKPRSTNKSGRTFIRWFGSLLAVALLIYLLSRVGWGDITHALKQISLWRFILCIFLMLLSRLAVAGRWHSLLRSVEADITPLETLQITFTGLFASNFLPTTIGGDVVRLGGAIQLGLDQAMSIASLIVDRLVGMAGMASALPMGIPALIEYINEDIQSELSIPPLYLGLITQTHEGLSRIVKKGKSALGHLFSAFTLWQQRPGSLAIAFAFTWIHQISLYSQIWILLRGMGETVPIWSIAGLWSATYFVTLLPVSINGMGMQELSATFFFTSIGGISLEHSLTLAILMRALQALASLPGALYIPKMISGEARPN